MVCIAFPDHTRAETGIRLLTCTTSSAGSSTRCWMPDCRRRRALRTRRRELGTVLLLHAYVGVWSEGTLPTKFSDHSATWWDKRLIETLSQLGVVPRVCYDTPVSRTATSMSMRSPPATTEDDVRRLMLALHGVTDRDPYRTQALPEKPGAALVDATAQGGGAAMPAPRPAQLTTSSRALPTGA